MTDLTVVCQSLRVGDRFVPHLSVRRIYNLKCFRPERYQHEVANHYRDFKLQQSSVLQPNRHLQAQAHPRQRQRRTRTRLRPLAPISTHASANAQFRSELPTPVHYFPRFGDTTYAPRGHQTICSVPEPTDVVYNDTLRRIRSAHSCDQLKKLVQRQLSYGRGAVKAIGTGTRTRENSNSSNSNKRLQQRDPCGVRRSSYEERVLNINTAKVENLQRRHIDLYAYLQLASGYYERGLHANIKYLQSLGQRNAIKQKQQKQQQQEKPKQRRYSLEAWPPQQQAVDQPPPPPPPQQHHLSTILNDLRHRERCQISGNDNGTADAISVHITPVQRTNSMFDYARQCSDNSSNNQNSTSSSGNNSALAEALDQQQQQRKLYEIIDNLSHLSIYDSGLPLITFTDYTQQVALYGGNFDIAGNCQLQIPNEARPPT